MLEAFRQMVLEDQLGAALIRSGDSVIIKEVAMSAPDGAPYRSDMATRVEPRDYRPWHTGSCVSGMFFNLIIN